MNNASPFDEVALTYDATVQQAIGASGESVAFFADLKTRLMAEALGHRDPETILDFGCGIGNTTRALAARFSSSSVTGFDVSAESVAVGEHLNRGGDGQIAYRTSNGDRLPFPDGSFASAFTSCVFHHIDPPQRVYWAREVKRVLAPSAPFFLFEHNPFNPLTRRVVRRVPFDEGVVLLKPSDAKEALRQAGFTVSRPHYYFFFPAFLRTLRPLETAMRRLPLGAQYFVVGR